MYLRLMPPGTLHMVFTPVPSIARGCHYFIYNTLHLTELARRIQNLHGRVVTNQEHQQVYATVLRLMLALPQLRTRSRALIYSQIWY